MKIKDVIKELEKMNPNDTLKIYHYNKGRYSGISDITINDNCLNIR